MKNPKQIIWADNNTTPPVNYLWKKDGVILENVGGVWKEAEEYKVPEVSQTVTIGEDEYTTEDLNKISNIIKGFTEVEQYPIFDSSMMDDVIYDAREQHNQVFGKILDEHLLYTNESYSFSRTSLGWLNISNFLGKTVTAFGTDSYGARPSNKIFTIQFGDSITEIPANEFDTASKTLTCTVSYDDNGTPVSYEATNVFHDNSQMWIPTLFGNYYCMLGISGPISINGEYYFIKLPASLAMPPYGNNYDTTKVLSIV